MPKKKADISTKRLINLAPNQWIQWLMQRSQLEVREIISSDFQWVNREGDVLVKAYSTDLGEFLILNELQLRYNKKVPRRMRAYAGLAGEKYELPVYPVLVNMLEASTERISSSFDEEFAGLRSIQDYRVINLWEVDVDIVFERNLSTLLPFVPILKGGGEEQVIRRALRELRIQGQPGELESMLGFFATYVLDTDLVQQILRLDMAILEQSPLYREMVKRSEQRGIAIGEQRGITIGEQRGEQRTTQRVANNMLRMGMAIEQVSEATGLSVEEVGRLQEKQV
ncbi:MAG: Rpn family recombination-promoting nuclease/putative transposase [Prochloron sp. SP5CPC1]|nr:Rpn family recombination-promoting nuclease/putative transposase [Candidatus Paraprochloron terpiosi SP5CPC1]